MIRFTSAALVTVFISLSAASAFSQRPCSPDQILPEPPNSATAYYDANTGDIYLSLGEGIVFAAIDGAPFGFVGGEFDESTVVSSTPLGQAIFPAGEIGWITSDASESLPAGIFNIGRLLRRNFRTTSDSDFAERYPEARFGYGGPSFGAVLTGFEVIPLPAVVIPGPEFSQLPEPSGSTVLLFAGVIVMLKRNRFAKPNGDQSGCRMHRLHHPC
jgi:hypothetical protein